MNGSQRVTVIIPAKDEEKTIGEIIKKSAAFADNVIVIDDSLHNGTSLEADKYGATVLWGEGKGKGAAIRYAIEKADADILIFIDADGSHKPEDINEILYPIQRGLADMVIASRIKSGSDELRGSLNNLLRLFGNKISALIINLIWNKGTKLTDVQNGFRAIKTSVARQICLSENSFAVEQEMVIKCLKNGFRICEVPSYESKRLHGKSHINPILMLPKYTWCIVKNIYS